MVNNQKKGFVKLFMILILVLSLSTSTGAIPPLPNEFYGSVQSFNKPAPPSAIITAVDSNGDTCGTFTVTKTGYYGTLSCKGKDTDGTGTGPTEGSQIRFKVGTIYASAIQNGSSTPTTITWNSGEFTNINLVAPSLVCGDNYCDLYENCATCPTDCGACPENSGGQGGSAGTGDTSSGTLSSSGVNPPAAQIKPQEENCEPIWACSDWGPCTQEGLRFRECEEINQCNQYEEVPETQEECVYEEELEVPPFNITETNRTRPSREEIPGVISTCEERMGVMSLPSLLFMFLFLLLLIGSYSRLRKRLKIINEDKKLKDIEKLKLKFKAKRESTIFTIIIFLISLIVYFYHYFFFLCKDKYINHLWLLVLLIALTPIIINLIIEYLRYRDSVKITKYRLLKDAHYRHFLRMIEITNTHLIDGENTIIHNLNTLESSPDFNKLIADVPELQVIYKDMDKLFTKYKDHKSALDVEKDLTKNITDLTKDKTFMEASKQHPELETLRTELGSLFKAYKTKQEIYDELSKIEEEYFKGKEDVDKIEEKDEEKKEEVKSKDKDEEDKLESFFGNVDIKDIKPKKAESEIEDKQEEKKEEKETPEDKEKQNKPESPNEDVKEEESKQEKVKQEKDEKKQLEEQEQNQKQSVLDVQALDNELFYLHDGKTLRSLRELREYIDSMSDDIFYYHVNNERNDFANWTKGALKLSGEAEKIRSAKSKEDMKNVLDSV